MRERVLQILLVVALVVAAFMLRARDIRNPQTSEAPKTATAPEAPKPSGGRQPPEAVVNAFFDAASRGDAAAYLALVAGDLERSLRNTRAQVGAEAFRKDLQRSTLGIKGMAITRGGDVAPGLVALDVELVFEDRNERQRILLAPKGRSWVITSFGQAEVVKPAIPYGTPVYEE